MHHALELTRKPRIASEAMILLVQKSVILVDDDPAILRSVGRLLRQYGFSVAVFDSVGAFRARAELDAAFCIVLDINLRDGSGIELRRHLSELGVSLPVIFITGNDSDATRHAALQAGCAAYLAKPFPAQSLIEPIRLAAAN